jgi:hypothetical protein
MWLVWSSDKTNWGTAETLPGAYALAAWIWFWMMLSLNPCRMRVGPVRRETYDDLLRGRG